MSWMPKGANPAGAFGSVKVRQRGRPEVLVEDFHRAGVKVRRVEEVAHRATPQGDSLVDGGGGRIVHLDNRWSTGAPARDDAVLAHRDERVSVEVRGAVEHHPGRRAHGAARGRGDRDRRTGWLARRVIRRGDARVVVGHRERSLLRAVEGHPPRVEQVGVRVSGHPERIRHQVHLLEAASRSRWSLRHAPPEHREAEDRGDAGAPQPYRTGHRHDLLCHRALGMVVRKPRSHRR